MFSWQSRRLCFYCCEFRWCSQIRRRRRRSHRLLALLQTLVLRELAWLSWNVPLLRYPGWGQMITVRSRWVIFAHNIVPFVSAFFAGSGKEARVGLNILSVGKLWFQMLDRLIVSIQVYRNFVQGVMFKVKRIYDSFRWKHHCQRIRLQASMAFVW